MKPKLAPKKKKKTLETNTTRRSIKTKNQLTKTKIYKSDT
ncbi:hypothetical protein C4K08_0822 [Pseudomonas chlororaphis subsp. aureofaciens]|nr:hypothetical protein C4K08_0822 [Pseudomonas chlororaphis subsp. aureofaciens]